MQEVGKAEGLVSGHLRKAAVGILHPGIETLRSHHVQTPLLPRRAPANPCLHLALLPVHQSPPPAGTATTLTQPRRRKSWLDPRFALAAGPLPRVGLAISYSDTRP